MGYLHIDVGYIYTVMWGISTHAMWDIFTHFMWDHLLDTQIAEIVVVKAEHFPCWSRSFSYATLFWNLFDVQISSFRVLRHMGVGWKLELASL